MGIEKLYIKDNYTNRQLLSKIINKTIGIDFNNDMCYLEIDIKKMSCTTTFSFQWLYVEQPKLISIEELKKIVKKEKINKLLNI